MRPKSKPVNRFTGLLKPVPVETKVQIDKTGRRAQSAYRYRGLEANRYGKFPLGIPVCFTGLK